jgi:uncharacterized protein (TIGR03435 family)
MFERYTERARRVLFFARYEASQLGSISIETEHLLLGLIREGKGLTSRIFSKAGISLQDVKKDVEGRTVFQQKVSTAIEIPFSTETKRVLQFAADEADRLLHNYIGTEHLLLALLREERSVAAQILTGRGLRLDAVRQQIADLTSARAAAGGGPSTDPPTYPHGIVPSYQLDVSRMRPDAPQGHFTRGEPGYSHAKGFTLRAMLARFLNVDERRIDMPPDLDGDERYELTLRLPVVEPWQAMDRRMLDGITRHFGISISRERRLVDAYVMTAPRGETPALRRSADQGGGGFAGGSIEYSTDEGSPSEPARPPAVRGQALTIGPVSMSGLTLADLAGWLEELLGHPVVDGTALAERYDIEVSGIHHGIDPFLAALEEQLGLAVTRGRHEVEMVVVRRRDRSVAAGATGS